MLLDAFPSIVADNHFAPQSVHVHHVSTMNLLLDSMWRRRIWHSCDWVIAPTPIYRVPLLWVPPFALSGVDALRFVHIFIRSEAGVHQLWGVLIVVVLYPFRIWGITKWILIRTENSLP